MCIIYAPYLLPTTLLIDPFLCQIKQRVGTAFLTQKMTFFARNVPLVIALFSKGLLCGRSALKKREGRGVLCYIRSTKGVVFFSMLNMFYASNMRGDICYFWAEKYVKISKTRLSF